VYIYACARVHHGSAFSHPGCCYMCSVTAQSERGVWKFVKISSHPLCKNSGGKYQEWLPFFAPLIIHAHLRHLYIIYIYIMKAGDAKNLVFILFVCD
jgi:hypothetical protein